jgi:hypothetical protein
MVWAVQGLGWPFSGMIMVWPGDRLCLPWAEQAILRDEQGQYYTCDGLAICCHVFISLYSGLTMG